MKDFSLKAIGNWLVGSLALALAHFILAKVSSLTILPTLSLPTLSISPLWLPAALSAVAALRWGIPALPAIFAGALSYSWVTVGDISFTVLLTSLGPALQAGVVAVLAGKLAQVGVYSSSGSGRVRYGPVSLSARLCGALGAGVFTAPTIGAIALCASGVSPWAQFPSIWWSWWSGDMIAVLLITPVAWHALQRLQGRDGLGDWLIPFALSTIALGPLLYMVHEAAELAKFNQQATDEVYALYDFLQNGISLALLIIFVLTGVTLVFLARQHSNTLQEQERSLAVIKNKDDFIDKALLASRSVAYTCRATGDFGTIYVHENIRAISGHIPEEIIVRSDFWESHVHPVDFPAFLSRFSSLVEVGISSHTQYRLRAADDRYLWVSDHWTLERDGEGQPLRISGIMTDISERMSIEEQLRDSQKMEAIGQLTGSLAHDFNNLLGIVVGNLDEVGERLPKGDVKIRRHHQIALDAALRGAEVTHSLLAVARRQPMEVRSYDLNAQIRDMLPLLRASSGSSVAMGLDLWPGELHVRLDAGGFSNVILNLVINARDALQEVQGERQITLRTRRVPSVPGADAAIAPDWHSLIEVVDTGAGMSEQIRARAFEPFFTTKERGHGTGLGLAMVYGYATQLHGTARIQSAPGAGTTVQLYLPLGSQAAATAA